MSVTFFATRCWLGLNVTLPVSLARPSSMNRPSSRTYEMPSNQAGPSPTHPNPRSAPAPRLLERSALVALAAPAPAGEHQVTRLELTPEEIALAAGAGRFDPADVFVAEQHRKHGSFPLPQVGVGIRGAAS